MKIRKAISKAFQSFQKAETGTVAITFALSIIPFLIAAGAAVDLGRFTAAKSHLQAALDAGTLAGAAAIGATPTQRVQYATDAFNANSVAGDISAYAPSINFVVSTDTVRGTASVTMPTSLLAVVGINNLAIGTETEVRIPSNKKAEIAFVLDYSGSMEEVAGTEVKYVAMRNAATKLINDLTANNADKVKFALVPFSHHVYTDLPKPYVLGQTGAGTWTGCTQDRQYPYNLTDATPTAANPTKWGQPNAPDHASWGCSGYIAHNLKLRPLTNDFTAVKNQLAIMTPYAWTHIALGVEFGYHVLSPNAPYAEGASYTDAGTIKYMVVLTDGAQTEPAFGPGGIRNVTQGENNLVQLCSNAKASGITILTMAVGIDDSATRNRLQSCATDPAQDFFVINTTNDMAQAFATITGQIAVQAFVSK